MFTGITPRERPRAPLRRCPGRPLPAGVRYDGAVPHHRGGYGRGAQGRQDHGVGADADGEPVENSTAMVQKATGADGRTAYWWSTGTEQWSGRSRRARHQRHRPGHDRVPRGLPHCSSRRPSAWRCRHCRTWAPPGSTAVLTGAQPGGIDAAGLAANQEFRSRYDVQAVTTYGVPVGTSRFLPRPR
ncbi:hypothetical protein QJS66_17535 [Kocuria rhizophila]|nr:hypothetical protein QJS66_17535 [Kocuria rhizophila]